MVADIQDTTFGLVIWLRGGNAKYWVTSNGGQSVSVTTWYEEHTQSSNTVAPRTDINTSRINSYRWNNLWSILSTQDYNNGTATKFGYSTSGMSSTSWLGSWDSTVSGEYRLRAISPANALKSAIGTTAIGTTTTPIYWDGSKFAAGDALKNLAYKDSLEASDIPDISATYATNTIVNGLLAAASAMIFKGVINDPDNLPDSHNAGDTYRVGTAGTYPIVDSNGRYCEVGTLIICVTNGTVENAAHWTAVETNEDGAVINSSTSVTDNTIAKFDGETGRIIKKSGVSIDNSNNLTVPGTALKITSTSGAKFILMGN
jgi:hypothetical protein